MSQRLVRLWITALLTIALSIGVVTTKHVLAPLTAIFIGILLAGGITLAFFNHGLSSTNKNYNRQLTRLLIIYAVVGFLALARIAFNGWSRGDVVGIIVLSVLIAVYTSIYRRAKSDGRL